MAHDQPEVCAFSLMHSVSLIGLLFNHEGNIIINNWFMIRLCERYEDVVEAPMQLLID